MGDTEDRTLLADIDAQIDALVADMDKAVDTVVGGVAVKSSQKLSLLQKQREAVAGRIGSTQVSVFSFVDNVTQLNGQSQ